jgi:hypothetical protein
MGWVNLAENHGSLMGYCEHGNELVSPLRCGSCFRWGVRLKWYSLGPGVVLQVGERFSLMWLAAGLAVCFN